MNKLEIAQQLRLAAEITENNKPWEVQLFPGKWNQAHGTVLDCLAGGLPIRIKPTPTLIPLEPSDIPPGSVFRREGETNWWSIEGITEEGIRHQDIGMRVTFTYYTSLHQAYYQINRSIPLLGKWDPTAWEPCSKPSSN